LDVKYKKAEKRLKRELENILMLLYMVMVLSSSFMAEQFFNWFFRSKHERMEAREKC
jgi:hypothetical protein